MNLYVRYPDQDDVIFRVAPETTDRLAGAFCACTNDDAPILPAEKLRTLGTDVYHIDPRRQPVVFMGDDAGKLRTPNFPEDAAAGYIDLSGTYYPADDVRLNYLLKTQHEPLLYQLGWAKVYEDASYSHRGFHLTEGLPNHVQQQTIKDMSLRASDVSPGFLQLTPDEVAEALSKVTAPLVKAPRAPAASGGEAAAPAAP
jgi:hypothetical protein